MDTMWNTLCACYILLYGFIFESVTSSSDFNFKERNWRRDVCLEEKNLTGTLSISTSAGLLRCGSLCSKDENCAIFSFNEQQQKCHGYSAINQRGKKATNIEPVIYNYGLTIHNEEQNFTNALATCAAECRQLMILDTAEKINYLFSRTDLPANYWIGLTDLEDEGQWKWIDGSTFVPIRNLLPTKFNNIDTSHTNSRRFDADCAVLESARSRLIDEHCSDKKWVVCEY